LDYLVTLKDFIPTRVAVKLLIAWTEVPPKAETRSPVEDGRHVLI